MNVNDKANFIDRVLGFYFDKPFMEAASLFPEPGSEVEEWYIISVAFERIASRDSSLSDCRRELLDCVEAAFCECKASSMLGVEPDFEEMLEDLISEAPQLPKHFEAICNEVLAAYES